MLCKTFDLQHLQSRNIKKRKENVCMSNLPRIDSPIQWQAKVLHMFSQILCAPPGGGEPILELAYVLDQLRSPFDILK